MAVVSIFFNRCRMAFWFLAVFTLFSCIPLQKVFFVLGEYLSLRDLLPAVEHLIAPGDEVVHRFVNDDESEAVFYLKRKVRVLKRPGEFHQPILGNSNGYYIEEPEFERLWKSATPVFFLVSHHAFARLPAEDLPVDAMVLARNGNAAVCCNPSAAHRIQQRRVSISDYRLQPAISRERP
jgi:hypothetical protein